MTYLSYVKGLQDFNGTHLVLCLSLPSVFERPIINQQLDFISVLEYQVTLRLKVWSGAGKLISTCRRILRLVGWTEFIKATAKCLRAS